MVWVELLPISNVRNGWIIKMIPAPANIDGAVKLAGRIQRFTSPRSASSGALNVHDTHIVWQGGVVVIVQPYPAVIAKTHRDVVGLRYRRMVCRPRRTAIIGVEIAYRLPVARFRSTACQMITTADDGQTDAEINSLLNWRVHLNACIPRAAGFPRPDEHRTGAVRVEIAAHPYDDNPPVRVKLYARMPGFVSAVCDVAIHACRGRPGAADVICVVDASVLYIPTPVGTQK